MDLKKRRVQKSRVIVIQKEKRQPCLFSFWITMTLINSWIVQHLISISIDNCKQIMLWDQTLSNNILSFGRNIPGLGISVLASSTMINVKGNWHMAWQTIRHWLLALYAMCLGYMNEPDTTPPPPPPPLPRRTTPRHCPLAAMQILFG